MAQAGFDKKYFLTILLDVLAGDISGIEQIRKQLEKITEPITKKKITPQIETEIIDKLTNKIRVSWQELEKLAIVSGKGAPSKVQAAAEGVIANISDFAKEAAKQAEKGVEQVSAVTKTAFNQLVRSYKNKPAMLQVLGFDSPGIKKAPGEISKIHNAYKLVEVAAEKIQEQESVIGRTRKKAKQDLKAITDQIILMDEELTGYVQNNERARELLREIRQENQLITKKSADAANALNRIQGAERLFTFRTQEGGGLAADLDAVIETVQKKISKLRSIMIDDKFSDSIRAQAKRDIGLYEKFIADLNAKAQPKTKAPLNQIIPKLDKSQTEQIDNVIARLRKLREDAAKVQELKIKLKISAPEDRAAIRKEIEGRMKNLEGIDINVVSNLDFDAIEKGLYEIIRGTEEFDQAIKKKVDTPIELTIDDMKELEKQAKKTARAVSTDVNTFFKGSQLSSDQLLGGFRKMTRTMTGDQLVKMMPIEGLSVELSKKFAAEMEKFAVTIRGTGNVIAKAAEDSKGKFTKAFDLKDLDVSKQLVRGMGIDKGVADSIAMQMESVGTRAANALDKSQQRIAKSAGALTANIQKLLITELKDVRTPDEFMQKMPAMLERITAMITQFNNETQKETEQTVVVLEKERAALDKLAQQAQETRDEMLDEQVTQAAKQRGTYENQIQERRIKNAKIYQQQLQESLRVTNKFAGEKGVIQLSRDFENLKLSASKALDLMKGKSEQALQSLKGMKFDPQSGKSYEVFAERIKKSSDEIRAKFETNANRITATLRSNIDQAEKLATKIARVKGQAAQAMARAVDRGDDVAAGAIAKRSAQTLTALNAQQEALLTQRKGFVAEMGTLGTLAAAENQKMIQTTTGDARAASKEYEKMGTGVKKHTMTMMKALGNFRDFWRRLRFIFFDIRMAIYGFGLTFLARNIIRFGSEVEYQLNIVASVANATNDQLKELTNTAEYMGRTSIFNTEQVAKGMYDLASAGLSVDQMLGVLNPAMKFAVINGENFEKSNRLIAMTMKQFGVGTEGVTKMVDIFTESIFSSQETMDRLMEGMKYAGPTGASFNQSLSSVVATLSAFVDLGYQGGHSGRYYRRALLELNEAVVKHSSVIRSMGLSIDEISPTTNDFGAILRKLANTQMDVTQAVLLFGSQAGPAIMNVVQAIREGRMSVEDYAKQLENSTGRVEKAYERQIKTAKGLTQLMQAAWGGLQIELFKRYEENLKNAAKWLLDLATDTQTWVKAGDGIKAIETVMNGVLFVLKQIVKYTPAILGMLGTMLIQFKGIGSIPILGKVLDPLWNWFKSMGTLMTTGTFLGRLGAFQTFLTGIAKFTLPFAITFLIEKLVELKSALDALEESYKQKRDADEQIAFAQKKAQVAIDAFNKSTGQHLTNLKDVNNAAAELGLTWNVITKTWVTAENQLSSFDKMVKKSADDFGKAEFKYQKSAANIDKALKDLTGAYNVGDLGKEPEFKFPAVEMAKNEEERAKALEDINKKQKAALQHNLENLNEWADENKKIYESTTAAINSEMAKRLQMLNTEESIAARRKTVQKETTEALIAYERKLDAEIQQKLANAPLIGDPTAQAAQLQAEKQAAMSKKRAELQAQEEIKIAAMTADKVKQFAKEKAAAQERENIKFHQSNAKSNEQLRKIWEERYKVLKTSLDEQTKLYQDYVKKIADAEKELFDIKKEGAAALRDLDREGMGELAQYEDKRKEIQELISEAQRLSAQGTEESIKQAQEMFKQALSLARGMNQEVKDADNNILVSKETVLQESKDAISQIVASQTRAQQSYIDVLNENATKTAESVTTMKDEMQTIQDKWLGISKVIEENPISVKFKADDESFNQVRKKIEDLAKTDVTITYKAELSPQGAQKVPGAGGEGGEEDTEAGVVNVEANTQPAEEQMDSFKQQEESQPIVKDVKLNIEQAPAQGFSRGGKIRGFGGGDVVPAWLEPGEWIMKKEAVRKYGVNLMNAINKMSFNAGYNPTPWENLMDSIDTRSNKSLQFAEGGIVPDSGDTTHIVLDFKGGKKVSLQGKKDMVNDLVTQLRRERLTSLNVH